MTSLDVSHNDLASLPAGLSMSSAGVITGTPTTVGSSSAVIMVTSGGATATATVTIDIAAAA